MKVSELITYLNTCDPDATVVTDTGPNVTRLTLDFQDLDPQQVFESHDCEYEGKLQDKMVTEPDGTQVRKVLVVALVDYVLDDPEGLE